MKPTMFLVLVAAALGLTACSHTVPVQGADGPEGSMSSPTEPKWTTNIRSVPQTRFTALDTARNISSSSVEWIQGERPGVSSVNIVFTYEGTEHSLSWAVLFGPCGGASLPLIPISSFPELEVSVGGRTQLNAEISLELPNSGMFHIDIYRDRRGGAESVVGCGNLRYVGPS